MIDLFGASAACSRATSRSTACARPSRRSSAASATIVADLAPREQRALFRDNAIRDLRRWHDADERAQAMRRDRLRRRRPDGPADGRRAWSSLGYAVRGVRHRRRRRTTRRAPPARRSRRRPPTRRAAPTLVLLNLPTTEAVEAGGVRRRRRRARARAAAARRRLLDRQGRQGPRVRREAARDDRLRLGRRAGVGRAARVGAPAR